MAWPHPGANNTELKWAVYNVPVHIRHRHQAMRRSKVRQGVAQTDSRLLCFGVTVASLCFSASIISTMTRGTEEVNMDLLLEMNPGRF